MDAAIAVAEAAANTTPVDHPHRAMRLASLSIALRVRSERTGAITDLNAAIEAAQTAVEVTPDHHPDRAGYLNSLGVALQARFARIGESADLEAAIEAGNAAAEITPPGHPNRAMYLNNLGNGLRLRFEREGSRDDLDAAIESARAAIDTAASSDPNLGMYLHTWGSVLLSLSELTEALTDLDAAIGALKSAAATTPIDHPGRAADMSLLGNAFQARFERTGSLTDLDAAIEAFQAALVTVPGDHPERAGDLSNVGFALRLRFEWTGAVADLDAAVEAGRAAIDAMPADYPSKAGALTNLGGALRIRYERTGTLADLEAAIQSSQAAVDMLPLGHRHRPMFLSNLGLALRAQFERTWVPADLDAAIEAAQAAVETAPANHRDRAMYLSNLGLALHTRFRQTGTAADLDAAIQAAQAAVETAPANHRDRAMYLSNLGGTLRLRFEISEAAADLDAAIEAAEAAVNAVPADHPGQAGYLFNLGAALRHRFTQTKAEADLDAALSPLMQAARNDSAAPSMRIRAARAAASLIAQSRPAQAADLLESAVLLLPEVTPHQLSRDDQQYAIGGFAGLAADAAALVLAGISPDATDSEQAKGAERALGLLEAGRAVLMSQALDSRSDITDLREQHPKLAERLAELREALDRDPGTSAALAMPTADAISTPLAPPIENRRRLAAELSAILARIRALDGFALFGFPPSVDELLAQASSGPVVSFSTSEYRCDALLLTEHGITSLELPDLTQDTLVSHAISFHQALDTANDPDADIADRATAQAKLRETLQWLWDSSAGPVLNALGYGSQPAPGKEWPRVWWATGGMLGLLPIHAAGYHTDPPDQAPRAVMGRIVSSWTPTIRALRYARQRTPARDTESSALIVALPVTPGIPGRLHHVPDEAAMLLAHLDHPVLLAELGNPDEWATASIGMPTKANVLAQLAGCPIVHFACHGASHPADPSQSRLLLYDLGSTVGVVL